ncbi:MAG: hypothetical protein A3F91_09680 [Flavobacteria bacterium RIFCSPLOWO2_12_FULL_35_11]|nr:MAG: hypothetical protein A3F91_09680 [Flavobacteria bacterium RIFCSPLOWO2_12_FULL_35_11]
MSEVMEFKTYFGKIYKIGDTVFLSRTERIDAFAHKRYTEPSVEKYKKVLFGGKIVGINEVEKEFSMTLFDNNNFEKDGQTYVFSFGNIIDNEIPKEQRGIYTYSNGLGEKLEFKDGSLIKVDE